MTEYKNSEGETFWTTECEDPIKAIEYALDKIEDGWEKLEFLVSWREGDVAPWPKFVEWVGKEAQKEMGK